MRSVAGEMVGMEEKKMKKMILSLQRQILILHSNHASFVKSQNKINDQILEVHRNLIKTNKNLVKIRNPFSFGYTERKEE